MQTIIGVGACYLDTILTVSHYPSEDEKLRAAKIEKRRGGNVPNTFEVLQQLLARMTESPCLLLVSVLPKADSTATEEIRTSLGPRVDLSYCFYRENSFEAPSSYILRSLATDSRTLVNYNELDEMRLVEFQRVVDGLSERKGSVYHFEGRVPDVIIDCIEYIRHQDPQAKISVEIEKPKREGLQILAQNADIVFYSKSWAQAQGYSNAAECLRSQSVVTTKASHLFCTWGSNGATAYSLRDREIVQVSAFSSESKRVLDTVGAGDTFIAGILYGLIYNPAWRLDKTLNFANQLAGHKVTQYGFADLDQKMNSWLE